MIPKRLLGLLLTTAGLSYGQLSTDQKLLEFEQIAGLYAKQYAPYEWKRDALGFDLLRLAPWIERVQASKDDLAFYEVVNEYVHSLNDAHSTYSLPSNFFAQLGFTVDVFDGKVLVDSINRTLLPAARYPFGIGDELVSVDGKPVEELINEYLKYSTSANPRSTRRQAAARITQRPQNRMPRIVELGDSATVVIRRASGDLETHTINWLKTGLPLTAVGPVPLPQSALPKTSRLDGQPDYMRVLSELGNVTLPDVPAVLGIGARNPIFTMPANFQQRLGRVQTDVFFSGVYEADGLRIGFIRIPSYGPPDFNAAVNQFLGEVLFFQQNTDGLIIDQMRNPGGQVSYVNVLAQLVIPYQFRSLGFEIRATSNWVAQISNAIIQARNEGAPDWVLITLQNLMNDLQQANRENRGRTGPLPLDDIFLERDPITDQQGRILSYTKPLMVLADEFSASGADMFPATIQDAGRGPVFGMRTMGAGGSVVRANAGTFTEGTTGITQTLMNRKSDVRTAEYPAAPYVENIGVRPDIEQDYMTRDNLMNGGRSYVEAFTRAMVEHIRRSRQ